MPEKPDKINLDQLFELKRAEKPSEKFWDGFQKEFRQRQLQSLIEQEKSWTVALRRFFARSSVWAPVSGLAVLTLVLVVNFRQGSQSFQDFSDKSSLADQPNSEPKPIVEVALDLPVVEVIREVSATDLPADDDLPASFVMDLIPNEEPESLTYTRKFPTSTIPAENRPIGALVSYAVANDMQVFGMARPRTIGF
ncbi:MAG: hypothetical protein KJT03_00835 [Verrucomicrobiae bacterium]|nr:hypothetical protein [Verrucomicrobiae bacterium]